MESKCHVCGKNTKLFCSRCRNVYYCSKDCQVSDRPNHKSSCIDQKLVKVKETSQIPSDILDNLEIYDCNMSLPLRKKLADFYSKLTPSQIPDVLMKNERYANAQSKLDKLTRSNVIKLFLHGLDSTLLSINQLNSETYVLMFSSIHAILRVLNGECKSGDLKSIATMEYGKTKETFPSLKLDEYMNNPDVVIVLVAHTLPLDLLRSDMKYSVIYHRVTIVTKSELRILSK
jgi:hypothetical protein